MWIFGPCSINESVTTETHQQRRSEGEWQRPGVHPSFINHHCIHSQWSQSRGGLLPAHLTHRFELHWGIRHKDQHTSCPGLAACSNCCSYLLASTCLSAFRTCRVYVHRSSRWSGDTVQVVWVPSLLRRCVSGSLFPSALLSVITRG